MKAIPSMLVALALVAGCSRSTSRPSVTMTTNGVVKPGESPASGAGRTFDDGGVPASPFENGPTGVTVSPLPAGSAPASAAPTNEMPSVAP